MRGVRTLLKRIIAIMILSLTLFSSLSLCVVAFEIENDKAEETLESIKVKIRELEA